MSRAQRRLAAIMFTDMVGYTSLSQTDETQAMKRLEEQRTILRSIFPKHDGREIKTMGDAFLVEFPSALEAVRCSIDIQQEMFYRNASLPEGSRVMLRIGIHLGDVLFEQDDILGDAVNVSSRIEPLADPGGVCISEQVYDHVGNKIPLLTKKLEQKNLKNVKLPISVYKIVMPWETEMKEEDELDPRRVAILPLKNMSPDSNDEYFADGMTEELITALSSVKELTVIARTSTMQYKNAPKRIADIGTELSVGTIIEGSVRKAGNKIRITVQLINTKNEGHLWAQNYDRQMDDIFTIQSEIAERVAETLKVKLVDSERRRIQRPASNNTDAYNLYLKGMFYYDKRTPEALKKAVDLLEQSLKLDPTCALCSAGLAQAYNVMASNYFDEPETCFPKAKKYALEALSLDEELAEAHTVLGSVALGYDHDLERAENEFKRAIELNPSYPLAHLYYAHLLRYEKRFSESWKEINYALELSPLSLIINDNFADEYFFRKEFDKAIEYAKKVIDMDPSFPPTYVTLIMNFLLLSKYDDALRAAETYAKISTPAQAKLMFAEIYASAGKNEEAVKLLSELEAIYKVEHVSPYWLAGVHFRLGQNDFGFEWLEKAYTANDRYIYIMAFDPDLNNVRSDPRYLSMLQKIGLAGRVKE